MSQIYDLIIIGGGINGAALARLAGANGLKTALFEKNDFASGTSSASSKLIHGGVRYLEYFQFGLVKESLKARRNLLKTAPHLVYPGDFIFPVTKKGRHGWLGLKLGMWLYDFLAGPDKLLRHKHLSSSRLKSEYPEFLPDEFCDAFIYKDCFMNDARLVLENVLDAKDQGVEVFNYHNFTGVEENHEMGSSPLLEVTVVDRKSEVDKEFLTRKVIFTVGPWNDNILGPEFSLDKPHLHRSVGVHLFIEKLPMLDSFILPVPDSPRYFFVLPFKMGHIIGTTESAIEGHAPVPEGPPEKDVEELKRLFTLYFPEVNLKVLSTFTGVRPLALSGKRDASAVSRRPKFHKVHEGVTAGVGGKYTTHREFAEELLKFSYQGQKDIQSLIDRPLPGAWKQARGDVFSALKEKGLSLDLAEVLTDRYGERAIKVADFILSKAEYQETLAKGPVLVKGEVVFSIKHEFAKTPEDFLRRRTDWFFTPSGGLDVYHDVKKIFTEYLPEYLHLDEKNSYPTFLKKNLLTPLH